MVRRSFIQKLSAGILLLVFAFSTAPKKFLHDAIADHKDKINAAAPGDASQFQQAGFICKCDNLVAESPYIHEPFYLAITPLRVFAVHRAATGYSFYSSPVFFSALRGPPSVIV